MRIREFSSASDFLEFALPHLEENEAANNLIIGLAFRLVNQPEIYPLKPFLAVAEEDDRPVFAALMTPPHLIILAAFSAEASQGYPLLIQVLRAGSWKVPGVRAPSEVAVDFTACWSENSGARLRTGQHMRVYELFKVVPARPVSGEMRLANNTDLEIASKWNTEFNQEALGEDDPEGSRRNIEFKIQNHELYLWVDEQPVSMAAAIRPTRHGIVIGGVYTPPSLRNRGYASALVAALSQRKLDSGYQFLSLFTNLANPTSNKIYQEVGYKPVCDFKEIYFDPPA